MASNIDLMGCNIHSNINWNFVIEKIQNEMARYYDEIHRRLKKDPALYKKYYQDGKVSVSELGGWECAKCHY